MNVSREWAKLFLENWNRAVELWNEGKIFVPEFHSGVSGMYSDRQLGAHQEYARLCCTWMLPNGFQEPHVVAEGG